MRHKLADHLNEYVLCKGWIGGWEDMKECSTRRVFIKQPTIKKADRNTLFAEQDVISTEHHLNLFIKFEDLSQYDTIWELTRPFSSLVLWSNTPEATAQLTTGCMGQNKAPSISNWNASSNPSRRQATTQTQRT